MSEYLPKNATTREEVSQYYKVRELEFGIPLESIVRGRKGEFVAYFADGSISVYLPPDLRGCGVLRKYKGHVISTTRDCGIQDALSHMGLYHQLLGTWCDYPEYKIIKDFYGDRKAARSGEYLMWHITKGCHYLEKLGASEEAIKAFMLHPIYQSDTDYNANKTKLLKDCQGDLDVLLLVLEYRKVANGFLCNVFTDGWCRAEIEQAAPFTSKDMALMLLADKLQNREDFNKYHRDTHVRGPQLHIYFEKWLKYIEDYLLTEHSYTVL